MSNLGTSSNAIDCDEFEIIDCDAESDESIMEEEEDNESRLQDIYHWHEHFFELALRRYFHDPQTDKNSFSFLTVWPFLTYVEQQDFIKNMKEKLRDRFALFRERSRTQEECNIKYQRYAGLLWTEFMGDLEHGRNNFNPYN